MKTIKPYIRVCNNVGGDKYQVVIAKDGAPFRKTYDTLEEAESIVKSIKENNKISNFDYPLDFIDLLFGKDETLDITYIENNFDENIKYALETLTEREARIITKRLIDGFTMKSVGLQEGVTTERIRQIEAKAIRKLRHPSRLCILRYGKEYFNLQDDIAELMDKLYQKRSSLIQSITDIDDALVKSELAEKCGLTPKEILSLTKIEELDLSVRAFHCLARANINNLAELTEMTEMDLRKIRNFGSKCLIEILTKLEERGLKLKEEKE